VSHLGQTTNKRQIIPNNNNANEQTPKLTFDIKSSFVMAAISAFFYKWVLCTRPVASAFLYLSLGVFLDPRGELQERISSWQPDSTEREKRDNANHIRKATVKNASANQRPIVKRKKGSWSTKKKEGFCWFRKADHRMGQQRWLTNPQGWRCCPSYGTKDYGRQSELFSWYCLGEIRGQHNKGKMQRWHRRVKEEVNNSGERCLALALGYITLIRNFSIDYAKVG